MIKEIVSAEFGNTTLPIIANAEFGHTDPQIILPNGIQVEINFDKPCIRLLEPCVE